MPSQNQEEEKGRGSGSGRTEWKRIGISKERKQGIPAKSPAMVKRK
jgi:hypothetical protein